MSDAAIMASMEVEKVLAEFGVYLSTRITPENGARILLPIGKLLRGEGVTHKNASGAFLRGRPLTLNDDVELVRQEAARYLPYKASDPNILDRGHGWALNHPIQWFWNFKYWKVHGIDPPPKSKTSIKKAKAALAKVHGIDPPSKRKTPIKKAKAKATLAIVSIPQPPQQPPPPSTAIVTANDEPSLPWPPSREARLASYCGAMLALVTFAKKHSKTGGISTTKVRNWLKKHPEYVPSWLEGQEWEVDHIVSDNVGGLSWPHNYCIMPKCANRYFSSWLAPEKKKYVGDEAWDGATALQRWARNKMRAVVDFSLYDPVGAQFVGRA
jgi:hypothetical protein